jgi:hypothetical protein
LFIHYEESTQPKLEALALEEEISKTLYQPSVVSKYYIAISEHSHLMKKEAELQSIVINGLKNNDFLRIRQEHYAKNQ